MKTKTKSGSALIFATIILFSLLAITVTLSAITVSDMKMSQKTKSSTGAFFNADSGVEWALNKIANTDQDTSVTHATKGFTLNATTGATACPGGFSCNIYLLKADGTVIKSADSLKFADIKAVRSVGTQGGDTQRAIEAAVASGGGGCYVDYSLGAGLAVGTSCGAVGGFTIKRSAGMWGGCFGDSTPGYGAYFRPPGGGCWAGTGCTMLEKRMFVACETYILTK